MKSSETEKIKKFIDSESYWDNWHKTNQSYCLYGKKMQESCPDPMEADEVFEEMRRILKEVLSDKDEECLRMDKMRGSSVEAWRTYNSELKPVIHKRLGVIDSSTSVFVVHGHDTEMLKVVCETLKKWKIQPITLANDTVNEGQTVIESFLKRTTNVSYAIVLISADDIGGQDGSQQQKPRARQNVIFELGYFVGLLGREKVFLLKKAKDTEIEMPTDIEGWKWTGYDEKKSWKKEMRKALANAGFDCGGNRINKTQSKHEPISDGFRQFYLPVFDTIFNLLHLEHFDQWAMKVAIDALVRLPEDVYNGMVECQGVIKHSVKSKEYPRWNSLMDNLKMLLVDFLQVVRQHAWWQEGHGWVVERFDKMNCGRSDLSEQERQTKAYVEYTYLLSDLIFELARLCNLILERIREICPGYKQMEIGCLFVGEEENLFYREDEKTDAPYPGIDNYISQRLRRTTHYGQSGTIDIRGYESSASAR